MGIFTSNKSDFPWIAIDSLSQLNEILSSDQKSLIFKHSTRCSVSSMALNSFENEFKSDASIVTYFLDLIKFRELSNVIAQKTGVQHESPQVIILEENEVIYKASHHKIDAYTINKI